MIKIVPYSNASKRLGFNSRGATCVKGPREERVKSVLRLQKCHAEKFAKCDLT
jgi:hypothetical protein